MKVQLLLFLWSFTTISLPSYGQNSIQYTDKKESASLAHARMEPPGKVSGILLLLPGLGEHPQSIFQKTALPALLAEHGFLTLVPDLGSALIADSGMITGLNKLIQVYVAKQSLKDPPVIVGGFSRGGAIALRFAEDLIASHSTVKLKGAFAIDPALDLKRLYLSSLNKIQYNCPNLIKKEGRYNKDYLEKKLGGPPATQSENYTYYSVYSSTADSGGNAKFLKDLPLRLYSEPDLDFVRKTYCQALQKEDINAYDLEGLYGFLQRMGNSRCAYLTTQGKGFHSWNILDARDCVEWMVRISNESQ